LGDVLTGSGPGGSLSRISAPGSPSCVCQGWPEHRRYSIEGVVSGNGSRSDTDLGINLGGGVAFINVGQVRPSAGHKIQLSGGEGFVLFGALEFLVG
jgi:hypothetical protein